jgi:dTDP-4-dehydrorhamnose reductase
MKTIFVTGAKGQVGCELQSLAAQYPDFEFLFTDLPELNITDEKALQQFLDGKTIDYCINCAAYTAVDKAESDQEIARKVNVDGVQNLAKTCLLRNIPLIHFSTDYVYHNNQNTPFKEGDPTTPQGVYAQTKLEGDETALQIHRNTLVLRTSWVYSSFGHNFVKTMLRLGNERDELNVIFDQIGTPTYAHDLAKAVLDVLQGIEQEEIDPVLLSGVYHYSNEGVTSWYDFAMAIFDIEGISCKVNPIETKDYPTAAARPHFSVLNKTKFRTTFGIDIPHWRESLKVCLEKLKA